MHAMQWLKKEQGRAARLGVALYAPIAQALSKYLQKRKIGAFREIEQEV